MWFEGSFFVVCLKGLFRNQGLCMKDFIFEHSVLDDVIQITSKVIDREKDVFIKSYEKGIFAARGIDFVPTEEYRIIEDKGIFRGIHFQNYVPQKSMLSVLSGEACIVVVDLNKKSSQLGKYEIFFLNEEKKKLIFIPEWYGVATISLADHTTISIMNSGQYYEQYSTGICYNDPVLNILWPVEDFQVSEKDRNLMTFEEYLHARQPV